MPFAAGVIAWSVAAAFGSMPPPDMDSIGALMNGPGQASSSVAAFGIDADSDGDFDLLDFAELQARDRPGGDEEGGAAFGPLYATQCSPYSNYCWVSRIVSGATGASAMIRTRETTLCGESFGESATAGSLAWVGVTYVGDQPRWGQIGYARTRKKIDQTKTVYRRPYAETQGTDPVNEYEFFSPPAPGLLSGLREYECYLYIPLFGTWQYSYDGQIYRQVSMQSWVFATGNRCSYQAEIWNPKDQMVGTAALKCDWTGCQQQRNSGDWEDTAFTPQDALTDDPNEWGIDYLSPTSFRVWDKNP